MAKLYPEELIRSVAAANDIVDVVGSYVTLRRSGSGYTGLCPFHKEKTPSFHVSADKQLYHCFGCGVGGNVIHFIMAAENLDFVEALKFLADKAGMLLPEPAEVAGTRRELERKEKLLEVNLFAARFFRDALNSPVGEGARRYIKERKLDEAIVRRFGIGYAPGGGALLKFLDQKGVSRDLALEVGLITKTSEGKTVDRFYDRLMVPIFDVRGRVIGFGGRTLSGAKAKYVNSPQSAVFEKGTVLYALNWAKQNRDKKLILAEGYMDVMSLHQAGFTGAVAGMGTALTPYQARVLARYADELFICYDSDEAGKKAAEAAIEAFSGLDVRLRVIEIEGGKDPDELIKTHGVAAFKKRLDAAKTATEYRLSQLKDKYDLDTVAGKIDFTTAAATQLSRVQSPVEREIYAKNLSDETGVSVDALLAQVKRTSAKERRIEEKKIVKAAVAEVKNDAQVRAERMMLYLMAESRAVFNRYKGEYSPDSFEEQNHQKIAQVIFDIYEKGQAPDAQAVMSHLSEDEAKAAAAVFALPPTEDERAAAADAAAALAKARRARLIEKYTKEGNAAELSKLLKN